MQQITLMCLCFQVKGAKTRPELQWVNSQKIFEKAASPLCLISKQTLLSRNVKKRKYFLHFSLLKRKIQHCIWMLSEFSLPTVTLPGTQGCGCRKTPVSQNGPLSSTANSANHSSSTAGRCCSQTQQERQVQRSERQYMIMLPPTVF